jgi:hypothetical protein
MRCKRSIISLVVCTFALLKFFPDIAAGASAAPEKYVIVAWNNLGMHCYDGDYSVFAVLPPFNTLFAQVIKVGDPPKIITADLTIKYEFLGNTYSAGGFGRPAKTNFWDYAQKLFNLPQPLAPDTGLTGNGLTGAMQAVGDHFEAVGIPLTEYLDWDAITRRPYPYQLAQLRLTKTAASALWAQPLASLMVVAPISSEFSCANCHTDTGDATTRYPITPTGSVKGNILAIHDYLNKNLYSPPLLEQTPVLCANCHGSNALGTPERPGIKNLSNAMHGHHNNDTVMDIIPDTTEGCYNCHPGPQTQCLRDGMSRRYGHTCTNCHGNMRDVAANASPWLTEPRCETCHGAAYAPDQPLYRESRGHGGIYCAGCHDSPHAYAPSREFNDSIKFIQLQGHAGTLRECTVCHLTKPKKMFRHAKPEAVQ